MFGLTKRMVIVVGVLVLVAVLFFIQNSKKSSAQTTPTGSGCQMQVTADVLNIRATADGKGKVVGKLTTGAVTGAQKTVQNGYRELAANKWVSNQFLKPVSGPC